MEIFSDLLILLIIFGVPLVFTVLNILGLLKKWGRKAIFWEMPALLIGFFYLVELYAELADYMVAIRRSGIIPFHTPLASWHLPAFLTFFIISVIGFIFLRIDKALPPIPAALCISSMFIGCVLSCVFIIQLGKNIDDSIVLISLVYPLNIILLYIRVIRQKATEMATRIKENPPGYSGFMLNICSKFLTRVSGWAFVSFLLIFPLFCVVTIVLVLFGQRPDAIVKVFTDTSEWVLSQQISPPDIDGGHYLCTVAAQGHPGIVHPIRYGLRHGKKIVVNRQLCVANAFEDAVAEKFPHLHKNVRRFYDTYGYPLSRHITTKRRADIVYLLMKPVEYIFIIFLYTVDTNPENRIAAQYSGILFRKPSPLSYERKGMVYRV